MASSLLLMNLVCIASMILLMSPTSWCVPVPTALPAVTPFTIFVNNETYYEIGDGSHRKTPYQPRPLPPCRNVTLNQKAYTIFENGTLRIELLNVTLNSSYYDRPSTTGVVTACIPTDPAEDYVKAVVTSIVPPAIAGFTLSFVNSHIRELRMCVCLLCMVLYLVDFAIMFVCSLASSGSQALEMQLRFLSLSSLFMIFLSSWTPLISSSVVIKYFESRGDVTVEKGRVVVKNRRCIVFMVFLLLATILGVTLMVKVYPKVVHYTGYERSPRFEEEFTRLPAVYVMAFVNLVVLAISRLTYGVDFYDPRLPYTKSNSMFLKAYTCMLLLWTVGEVLGSYFFLDLSPIVFFMISVLMPLFIPHYDVSSKANVLPDVLLMSETVKNLPELVQDT